MSTTAGSEPRTLPADPPSPRRRVGGGEPSDTPSRERDPIAPPAEPARLRFGPFELDPRTGELSREGRAVPLQPKPARLLALLAGRAGELVTRGEIREAVWADQRFLEFDQALNFAVRQIRRALDDRACRPLYVQTLPRRGYRFVAELRRPGSGARSGRLRRHAAARAVVAVGVAALLALATLALAGSRLDRAGSQVDRPFGPRGQDRHEVIPAVPAASAYALPGRPPGTP